MYMSVMPATGSTCDSDASEAHRELLTSLHLFSTMDDYKPYNEPDDPTIEATTSVYGWTNEKDHEKVLIYVPAKIRRHEEFPLEKGKKVDMYIDKDSEELVVSTAD